MVGSRAVLITTSEAEAVSPDSVGGELRRNDALDAVDREGMLELEVHQVAAKAWLANVGDRICSLHPHVPDGDVAAARDQLVSIAPRVTEFGRTEVEAPKCRLVPVEDGADPVAHPKRPLGPVAGLPAEHQRGTVRDRGHPLIDRLCDISRQSAGIV